LSVTASSSDGGAIHLNAAGSLLVEDCTLSGNAATDNDGGAINVEGGGAVTVRRSTLSGNTAGQSGGAVYFFQGGSLTVENSTLSGNTANDTDASLGGGAIYFYGAASKFLVSNSTFSGNAAPAGSGGAVLLRGFTGAASFQNSTITANAAGGNGGGIARVSGAGTVTLSSTIVAGNANANANTPDLSFNSAASVGGNSNLVGVAGVGNFTLSGTGNQAGTQASPLAAKLGALANNGGPTLTHALLTGSPAINQGNNSAALAHDQRGVGFARVIGAAADVGALEVQTLAPPATVGQVTVNGGVAQRSRVTSLKVTFDQAVTLPGNPADAFQLTRQAPAGSVTLAASVSGNSVTLTFTGGTVDANSLADGRYTLTVLAAQVNGGNFDGDGNGIPGDNFVLTGDPAQNTLFRLFGDSDGDGDVDAQDFGAFRAAFGGTNNTFDFDNDGDVDAQDFGQFRARFGSTV
jgi:uncharacterized protein (DUF2141 family)